MNRSDQPVPSTRPYLIRALYEWCTENGFSPYIAVQVDADGQHDPAEIGKLLAPIMQGEADVVIGSRRAGVVELKQGINAGERIIVDGTGKLRAGLKVDARPVPPVDAPAPEKLPPPPAAPASDAPVAPAGNGG
mgnify:CR=1 FL=1